MAFWSERRERQRRAKRILQLDRAIKDEAAHIMGHKFNIDRLKKERDTLLNWREEPAVTKVGK